MKLIEWISNSLPNSRTKQILRKLFYGVIFSIPFKNYQFRLLDQVNAKFKRFLFCRITEPDFELKGYIKYFDIQEGDVIIDAGSFPGEFTIYASKKVGERGKIIAFEPDEFNFKVLLMNIKINNLDNVIPLKKGIWSKDIPQDKRVSLDNELGRLGIKKVDFIKMDIEGTEIEAIKGARKTLMGNKVDLAIASYHVVQGRKTYTLLEKMLKDMGFKVKTDYPTHLTTYASKN